MNTTFTRTAAAVTILLLSGALATGIRADERYGTVTDEATKKECGACHMAFQPRMLPARSWQRIMATLDDHFGEDASLDPETTRAIRDYLVENAADSTWRGGKFMRGLAKGDTPLRITETPYWRRKHDREVSQRSWQKAGSKANCLACHRYAEKGYYDDD